MPAVILPCPECGGDCLLVIKNWPSGKYHTYCNCGHIGRLYPTRKKAIDAHNALPRMSTIIAWQFQAAGAALALQRLMDAAQAMREAQQAWEDFIREKQDDCAPAEIREAAYNVGDAEDAFDDLLAGMLKDMETRHGRH